MSYCIYLIQFNIISKLIAFIKYKSKDIMIGRVAHLRNLINPAKHWAMYSETKNENYEQGMKKQILQIEKQFQKRVKIIDSKIALHELFMNQIEKKTIRRQKLFSIVCRKYAYLFREEHHKKLEENHKDSKPLLGKNYQLLNSIDLNRLYIICKKLNNKELMDIVGFFNCNIFIEDISTRDSIVTNFVDRLSINVKNRLNNVGEDRLDSYLSKIVRCSQTYSSKLYPFFIQKFHKQVLDLNPHIFNSLNTFIESNRNCSEQTLIEIKVMVRAVEQMIQKKWFENSLKISAQVLIRIIDYSNSNNFIFDFKPVLNRVKQQLSTLLVKKYKQFSTPELSHLVSLMLKLEAKSQVCQKIYRLMIRQIADDGQTSIDPNFYVFYQYYCKDNHQNYQMGEEDEQKLINLFVYYLKLCKKFRIRNLSKFAYLIENGNMKLQNRLILIRVLSNGFFKDLTSSNFKLFHMRILMMIKFCIKYQEFQTMSLLIKQLLAHTQVVPNYFSDLLTNINLQLFEQLCPPSKKTQKQKNNLKFEENLNIHYLFIKNIIGMLSLNMEYEYLLNELNRDYQQIPKQLLVQILKQLQHLPIPLQYHASYLQLFDKCYDFFQLSDDTLSHRLIYNNYKSLRDSKLKIQLFLALFKKKIEKKFISSTDRNRHFLKLFCNNRIRSSLTIFLYQQLLQSLLQIIQQESLQSKEYQFTIVRIFSDLAQISNNFQEIQIFLSRIKNLKFGNAQIFSFFYNIIEQNKLPKPFSQKINEILKKNWKKEDPLEKQLSNYERVLEQIIKIQKNESNISVVLYLLEVYNRQIGAQLLTPTREDTLLINLVRTIRLIHQNYRNNEKVKERIGVIFKQRLTSLCLSRQTRIQWKFQALKIGYQINLIMPEVFHKVIQITQLNPQWQRFWRAQPLFQLLIQYPVVTKWNNYFVTILINLLMANPNFKSASLLNEKIEEFKVANNLSEQSHTYIKFIQNKLKN